MTLSKLKQFFLLFTVILLLNRSAVFAGDNSNITEYTAIPMAYESCNFFTGLIDRLPIYCGDNNSTIFFMVKGENLTGLKKGSMKLNSLTLDGVDISKDYKGNPTYSLGGRPEITDNGKYLAFNFLMKKVPFRQVQNLKVDGEIDVLIGDKFIELSKEVDLSKPYEVKLGDFTLTNKPPFTTLEDFIEGLFSPFEYDRVTIRVSSSNPDSFISLEIKDGSSRENKKEWVSWRNGTTDIIFQNPRQFKVTLHLKYWDNLKQETVKLSF